MNPPKLPPLRLTRPDPAYRLSPTDRVRVRPGFDVDALEKLMGMISPPLRAQILRSFLILTTEELASGPRPGWLTQLNDPHTGEADPVLQAVLGEVYAPLWDELPDEALEIPNYTFYPGRERAKERREARRREQPHPPGVPDPSFHLSEADRDRLRPGFDPDALERLLRMVRPGQRQEFLQSFQWPEEGKPFEELVHLGDPELQAALEEVWAPFWERLPPGELETDTSDRPGKALARARRAARQVPRQD
jgi:hypothetical protein